MRRWELSNLDFSNVTLGIPKVLAVCLAVVVAATPQLPAGQPGLHREGEFWVETTTGSEAVGQGEQLKITTIGDVLVRGTNRDQIEYTLIRRVRARNAAGARDALQEAGVTLTRQGKYMRLGVDDSTGPVSLQVMVPRNLRGVIIGNDSGGVEVSDFGGSVVARTAAGDVRMNRISGSVDVATDGGALHLVAIGSWAKATTDAGDITADTVGGEARFETGGGNITVQKVGADIRAITAGGKVRIGDVSGTVVASSGGGIIDIGRAGGAVTASNDAGPIVVGSANGGVHCASGSGAVKVGPTSGALKIVTASGSIVAQLQGDKLTSDSYVSTESGDVTVFLPPRIGLTIRARNTGATHLESIVSEFPGLQIGVRGGTATAIGALNGGGPLLQIQVTSGTIWIRKK
jgi:DUF4097 and DUF4098 domain-containing protein YvlB